MLEYRTCRVCGESHALQRNGRMSIHTTAAGERCTEPSEARPAVVQPPRAEPAAPSEIQQAFDFIHEERHARRGEAKPLDRRIYATERVTTVRGGLPTHGRRS